MIASIHHITRDNHLKHIISTMPIITGLFILQMYIMGNAFPGEDFVQYNFVCAGSICFYIGLLWLHDTKVMSYLYPDKIETHTITGEKQTIYLKDIERIYSSPEETPFGSIIIKSKEKTMVLRFIDFPKKTEYLIIGHMKKAKENNFSQAA